jgi:hypothetical protein
MGGSKSSRSRSATGERVATGNFNRTKVCEPGIQIALDLSTQPSLSYPGIYVSGSLRKLPPYVWRPAYLVTCKYEDQINIPLLWLPIPDWDRYIMHIVIPTGLVVPPPIVTNYSLITKVSAVQPYVLLKRLPCCRTT